MKRALLLGLIATLVLGAADKEVKKAKKQLQRNPASAAPAFEIPQPFIAYVFPPGVRRGQTIEAVVSGTNLRPDSSVSIGGSGVTARLLSARDNTQLRIAVEASAEAAPCERELRVATLGGVSNRFRFVVGGLPEIVEAEPNSDRTQPQALAALPLVVNGQIQESDRDYFRFHARTGEKIVLEMHARHIIPFIADGVPGWFDPVITIYDANGREVQYADDHRIQSDPVLIFDPPRDGDYTVEVRDIIHRGRGDFVYRLTIGVLPFVSHIFPLGGRRGSTVDVALSGVNLPASHRNVEVARDAPDRLRVEGIPFAPSGLPETFEAERNDALRVQAPVVVNGRIDSPGDTDTFIVRVEPKQKLVFEIQARRLESPLDSMLTLTGAAGKVIAESDDWQDPSDSPATHHADSRILHTFTAGGDYTVRVADVQNNGGPEYAYRLVIAQPQPDFALRISLDNPRLGQGDTTAITVDAIRKDGFDREIRLSVEDLPEGFLASDAVIQSGQTQARLTITAPPGAPLSVISPAVTGTAVAGDVEITRRAETAEPMMQAFASTHYMPTAGLAMAVLKPGAFTLSAGDGKVLELARGSEVSIPVKVHRAGAQKAPVTLTGTRIGTSITMKPAVCPADADEVTLTLTVAEDAPVGLAQNLIITGVMRLGRDTVSRFAPAIPIRVVAKVQ